MDGGEPATIHASAVAVGERGILIRGASGSGKSTLVLQMLQSDRQSLLVADDRVALSRHDDNLIAVAPPALAGLLEVRGLGILALPHRDASAIHLVVDLLAPGDCPRLPAEADQSAMIEGLELPRFCLPIGSNAGPSRIFLALALLFGESDCLLHSGVDWSKLSRRNMERRTPVTSDEPRIVLG